MKNNISENQLLPKIYVCTNFRSGVHSSCAARGSKKILRALEKLVDERSENIIIEQIVCLGQCEHGPNLRVAGQEIINKVSIDDLPEIIDEINRGQNLKP